MRRIAHGAARSAARLAILLAMLTVPLFAASPARAAPSEFYGIAQGTLDLQDYEGMQAAKVHTERFLLRWRTSSRPGHFDWTERTGSIGGSPRRGSGRCRSCGARRPGSATGPSAQPPLGSAADKRPGRTS